MGREQRRLRNWLISPVIQIKVILSIILVAAVFLMAILIYSYWTWSDVIGLLIEMTDVPRQVKIFLQQRFTLFFFVLSGLLLLQFAILTFFLVVHTHRFVGASFAIKRFVRDRLKAKDFSSRMYLRQGDYLVDVAEELNELAEVLESQKEGKN